MIMDESLDQNNQRGGSYREKKLHCSPGLVFFDNSYFLCCSLRPAVLLPFYVDGMLAGGDYRTDLYRLRTNFGGYRNRFYPPG